MLQVRENEISLHNSSGGSEYLRTAEGHIADDAMQMDVHKMLYSIYTTNKMPHVTVTITKIRFVGSTSQVYCYYDNLHSRLSAYFQCRAILFK